MADLTSPHYRRELLRELARLEALLEETDPSGWEFPVPACPGWTVADLIRHLGGVHRNITRAVENRSTLSGRPSRAARQPPEEQATLNQWLQAGGEALLTALDQAPSTPAWTFDPDDQTVGFWQGRMLLETAMHRVDAEVALGQRTAIPAKLAADGVTEVVEVMVRLGVAEGRLTLPDYAIALHATDTGDSWQLGTGSVAGTVSGAAEHLFLCCWRREDPGRALTLDGDFSSAFSIFALPLTP